MDAAKLAQSLATAVFRSPITCDSVKDHSLSNRFKLIQFFIENSSELSKFFENFLDLDNFPLKFCFKFSRYV